MQDSRVDIRGKKIGKSSQREQKQKVSGAEGNGKSRRSH
jgi:hypothetical protein